MLDKFSDVRFIGQILIEANVYDLNRCKKTVTFLSGRSDAEFAGSVVSIAKPFRGKYFIPMPFSDRSPFSGRSRGSVRIKIQIINKKNKGDYYP